MDHRKHTGIVDCKGDQFTIRQVHICFFIPEDLHAIGKFVEDLNVPLDVVGLVDSGESDSEVGVAGLDFGGEVGGWRGSGDGDAGGQEEAESQGDSGDLV